MKRKFFSALLCAMISFCLIVSSAACAPEENKEPDDGGPPIVTPQPDDDKDNETPGEDPDGEGDPSGEGPGEDETPDEEPPSESGLTFELHSDGYTCYVSGIGTCTDTEIVIPDYYNGLPVTNIGGSAFKGSVKVSFCNHEFFETPRSTRTGAGSDFRWQADSWPCTCHPCGSL